MTSLSLCKLKEFADYFKFDENGGKFSERVEMLWEKENSSLGTISPFPAVFSKDLHCRHVKTRGCLRKCFYDSYDRLFILKVRKYCGERRKCCL